MAAAITNITTQFNIENNPLHLYCSLNQLLFDRLNVAFQDIFCSNKT